MESGDRRQAGPAITRYLLDDHAGARGSRALSRGVGRSVVTHHDVVDDALSGVRTKIQQRGNHCADVAFFVACRNHHSDAQVFIHCTASIDYPAAGADGPSPHQVIGQRQQNQAELQGPDPCRLLVWLQIAAVQIEPRHVGEEDRN